jgi:ABC-2 type transport system permease protein
MKREVPKMRSLLYKEFRLAINPLFYLVLLFGVLLLIPEWVFLLAPMYFLFTALPNIFTMARAQNDIGFSVMLPVRRRDIVKARIASMVIFEVAQIVVTAIFAVIHLMIFQKRNFLMDPNAAYIGCVFLMFGIFNIIFFPMFYKTAYKIGLPVMIGVAAALVFSFIAEMLILAVPALQGLGGRENIPAQLAVMGGGIAVFILLSYAAYSISAKRFDSVNI